MSISGFVTSPRSTAQLSVKLLLGVWLLSCVPVMAQMPNSRLHDAVLITQNQNFLREGDRGPAVRELQQKLNSNGLFPETIDGVYGAQTTRAVRQFQSIRGLTVTGDADAETLDLLGVDLEQLAVGLYHPDYGFVSEDRITPSSSVEDVQTLQQVLRTFEFDLDIDGIYGAQTEQAVRTYERSAGLPVDGIADRDTLIDMGFTPDGRNASRRDIGDSRRTRASRNGGGGSGSSRSIHGRYVAAIITTHSELNDVRQDFPDATPERNNLGEYISIGRFVDPDDADDWVDFANRLGYEARIIRD